jgi:hypothetical protein
MINDLCGSLAETFLKSSWKSIEVLVNHIKNLDFDTKRKSVSLFCFKEDKKLITNYPGNHFFLRGSVEYSNPQLTIEEVQGIIGLRLLEAFGNYFLDYGMEYPKKKDFCELCETLRKPPKGKIVPFLLNTDEIEADRYSMNPLRESIVESGQSAFPVVSVHTNTLNIDKKFFKKYEGSLISKKEFDLIDQNLTNSSDSYLDFVDKIKYSQLANLFEIFGIDLSISALRMPLTTLKNEDTNGFLHDIIKESHQDYDSISQAYSCMNRSMNKRTTLLTTPHSKKGYGSKRAVRGKIRFQGEKLKNIRVKYQTTLLYPNEVNKEDVSIAKANDDFIIEGEDFTEYSFLKTPSSPQFFLYSLGSPEDAAVWHGVGAFGASKLLRSYISLRHKCTNGILIRNFDKYKIQPKIPLHFNLDPKMMWIHSKYGNIDASIGCVIDPSKLIKKGMKVDYLSAYK